MFCDNPADHFIAWWMLSWVQIAGWIGVWEVWRFLWRWLKR